MLKRLNIKDKRLVAVFAVVLLIGYLLGTTAVAQQAGTSSVTGNKYEIDQLSLGDIWQFDYANTKYSAAASTTVKTCAKATSSEGTDTPVASYYGTVNTSEATVGTSVAITTGKGAAIFKNSAYTAGTVASPVAGADKSIPTLTATGSGALYSVVPNSTGTYRVYVYSPSGAPAAGSVSYYLIDSYTDNNDFASGDASYTGLSSFYDAGNGWFYSTLEIGNTAWSGYALTTDNTGTSNYTAVTGKTSNTNTNTLLGGGSTTYYYTKWIATENWFETVLVLKWNSGIILGPITKQGDSLSISYDSDMGSVTAENIFGETVSGTYTGAHSPIYITASGTGNYSFTGLEGGSVTPLDTDLFRYDFESTASLTAKFEELVTLPSVMVDGNTIDAYFNSTGSSTFKNGTDTTYTFTADFTGVASGTTLSYTMTNNGTTTNGTLTSASPSFSTVASFDTVTVNFTATSGSITKTMTYELIGSNAGLTPVARIGTTAGTNEYYFLEDALVASNGGKSGNIFLLDNYTMYSGNNPRADWTATTNSYQKGYYVKSGVTLVVPYNAGNTIVTNSNIDDDDMATTVTTSEEYRRLTLPQNKKLTIAGNISLASQRNRDSKGQAGPYGLIYLNSGSNLSFVSGSNLYAFGYIKGSGTVDIASGAKVYENMFVADYPGSASNLASVYNAGVFPLVRFTIRNVEAPMTLASGAEEQILFCLWGSNPLVGYKTGWIKLVGSGAMFQTSGSLTKSYSGGRQYIDIEGTSSINSASMTVYITASTTETSGVPIPFNFSITIKNGTTTLNENVILSAGSIITVNSGATVSIASGKKLYVLDSNDDTYGKSYSDAKLDVNGTINVVGGIFTSTSKANITSSKKTGKIVLATAAPSSASIKIKTGSNSTGSVSVTAAQLHNGTETDYTTTTGADANTIFTYCEEHNQWEKSPVVVTFSANDGSETPATTTQNIDRATDTALNANTLINPGHVFSGWNTKADGTGTAYEDGATVNLHETADITLYAQWEDKASFTPTLSIAGWTYGDVANEPVVGNNTSGGDETYTYKLSSAEDSAYSDTVPSAAGEYTVKATIAETDDYKEATVTADFTIAARSVTVSGVTANDKTYDGSTTATLNTTGAAFAGIVDGDTLTAMATGTFADANVGTDKAVTISGLTLGGTSAGNYVLASSGNQTGTTANITAKSVTVSGITANNKIYDGTTAATLVTSGAAFNGIVSGDTLTVSASGSFADANASTDKKVTISGLTLGGSSVGNYVLATSGNQAETTADITAKALTITADSAEKTYDGTALTKSTYTYSNDLIGDDAITSVTVTGSQTNAGNSNNVPSAAVIKNGETDVTANYAITYENGALTVTQAPINNVTVDIAGWTYGDEANTPSGTADFGTITYYYKLKGADDSAYAITVPTDAGEYTVSAYVAETDNYVSNYATVDFTIAPKAITITADGAEKTYDGTALTKSTYTNSDALVGDDAITSVTVTGSQTNVGSSANTPSTAVIMNGEKDATANYAITYVNGMLTVNPKTVTVKANDASKTYGETDPALRATVTGLAGEDTVTYTVNRETGENAGSYVITATGTAEQGNYTVAFENGTFTINPIASVTVTIIGHTDIAVYDGTEHSVSGYDVQIDNALYTEEDFTFNGTDSATQTDVGKATMGLAAEQFANTNANFAEVIFRVTDGYQTITAKQVSPTVTLEENLYTYTGEEIKPAVTLMDGEAVIPATEYMVVYSDNTDVGTATVNISDNTGGNYSFETVTVEFTIQNAEQTAPEVSKTDETIYGKEDGSISDLTTAMEFSTDGETFTAVETEEISGLAAGTYYVRYAEKANYNASPATEIKIAHGRYLVVTWANYDGTALETDEVAYNTIPTYDGETPVKPESTDTEYAFAGWDKEITAVTEDTTYTATYTGTTYVVEFITEPTLAASGTATVRVQITKNGTLLNTKADYTAELASWTLSDTAGNIEVTKATAYAGYIQYSLKGLSAGDTTLVISRNSAPSIKAELPLSISHKVALTVTPSGTHLVEDGAVEITAVKFDGEDAELSDYTFTSSDESIATVSGTTITPVSAGSITITATRNSDGAAASASISFKNAAARIGETYYATISAAMKAADSGDTVLLVNDVTESVHFQGNTPRVDGFELTLDLNGHVWSAPASSSYALRVDYGIVTVKDSVGGGEVSYGKDFAFMVSHVSGPYTSKLILESGTFTGKTSVVQVGYPGGSGANYKYYGGELEVTGGTFITVADAGENYDANGNFRYTLNMLDMVAGNYAGGIYSPSSITVTGGTFKMFDPADNAAEGAGTNFLPETYISKVSEIDGVNWYTVVKTYKVTFHSNGGTDVETQVVESGANATSVKPTRELYVFDAWYIDEELTSKFNFSTPITANIDLYANWKEADVAYTNLNGVTSYQTFTATTLYGNGTYALLKDVNISSRIAYPLLGNDITLDLNGHSLTSTATDSSFLLTRAGTEEKHKVLNIVDNSEEKGGTINMAADIKIQAKYNDVTIGEGVTINGASVDVLSTNDTLTVNGTINGGSTFGIATNGSSTKDATITVNGTVTSNVTAMYLPGADGLVVTVNGTVIGSTGIEIRAGELTVNDGAVITATGSFSEAANGSGTTVCGAAIAVSQHTTNLPITVTVNGGTLTGEKAFYEVDLQDENTEGLNLTIKDGTFYGEVSSENAEGFVSGGEFSVSVEPTYVVDGKRCTTTLTNENGLYYIVNEVTVTFDPDGGTEVDSVALPEGETVTEPTTTRTGYSFDSWQLEGEDYDFSSPVNANITLTATWTPIPYTITWLDYDGTVIDTTEVEYDATPTHANATRADDSDYHYTFAGWSPAITTVTGEATYTATYTTTDRTYGEPVWTWAEDKETANAAFTTNDEYAEFTLTEEASVTHETTTAETCEDAGIETYTATVEFRGETFTATAEVEREAIGHDYTYYYIWNSDNSRVVARRVCKNDSSHTDYEAQMTVSEVTKEATCQEFGEITYTAAFSKDFFETQTKVVKIPMSHIYENEWVWLDSTTAYVEVKCSVCGDVLTRIAADITCEVTLDPTCTEEGVMTYTATAVYDGRTLTDSSYTESIPAIGHDVTEHEATAPTCNETGSTVYWSCDVCGKYFSDAEGTEEIEEDSWVITALGHTFGEPTWSWASDYSSATATFTCTACGIDESVTDNNIEAVTVAATETVPGSITYTAEVEMDGIVYTDQQVVTLDYMKLDYPNFTIVGVTETFNPELERDIVTITDSMNGQFTVTYDMACVVAVKTIVDGEEVYTRLTATATDAEDTYSFDLAELDYEFDSDIEIIVAIKGDINGSGGLDGIDAGQAKSASISKITLSGLKLLVGDVNGNGVIDGIDAGQIKSASISRLSLKW